MKKIVLATLLGAFFASALLAQNSEPSLDAKITAAVNSIAKNHIYPKTDASVGAVTVADTQSVSSFSLYLVNKITAVAENNALLNTRRASANVIEGNFVQSGNNVKVTLWVNNTASGTHIGETDFTVPVTEITALGLSVLPLNRENVNAIKTNDAVFSAASGADSDSFSVRAWCDSDTRIYYDGEKLRITLESSADCYFKIYHTDTNGFMQLIYPNIRGDGNNFLKANKSRTVPEKSDFVLQAPFGEDTVMIVASTNQFADIAAEMTESAVKAEKNSVSRAMSRGLSVSGGDAARTASYVFTYTVLKKNIVENTFVYTIGEAPADIKMFVDEMRKSARQEGGSFDGNETSGNFATKTYSGKYTIAAGKLTLVIRHAAEQSVMQSVKSNTRGAISGGYSFTFEKPGDIKQAVTQVKTGIQQKGGNFRGDENAGEFSVIGIAGSYAITGAVNVTITEKPGIISTGMIEKEVKKFFGAK